jgi:hypothetical protein
MRNNKNFVPNNEFESNIPNDLELTQSCINDIKSAGVEYI